MSPAALKRLQTSARFVLLGQAVGLALLGGAVAALGGASIRLLFAFSAAGTVLVGLTTWWARRRAKRAEVPAMIPPPPAMRSTTDRPRRFRPPEDLDEDVAGLWRRAQRRRPVPLPAAVPAPPPPAHLEPSVEEPPVPLVPPIPSTKEVEMSLPKPDAAQPSATAPAPRSKKGRRRRGQRRGQDTAVAVAS